ncbi:MAG: glycosyltransferase [Pirellulales bacterium]
MNEAIQGLWVGEALSDMERMSLTSYLRQGHEYHLYAYNDVKNIPPGTVLKDANEILPESSIFRHEHGKHKGSVAPFADWFRYCLLWERGGWWSDTDVICLRPLHFGEPLVLASERRKFWRRQINPMLIKAPPGHPLIGECRRRAEESDKKSLEWCAIGPEMFTEVANKRGFHGAAQPPEVFAPLDWWHASRLVRPTQPKLPATAHTLHLWNEMWRMNGMSKTQTYPATCLYEQLKARFLTDARQPVSSPRTAARPHAA